jgi:undecaprenyl pyrophosphate synthase
MARRSKPLHVGFIPDGTRRWALSRGMPKEEGCAYGISPGISLMEKCIELGIAEASIYGFAKDNAKRPRAQKLADFYVRDEYWPDFKLRISEVRYPGSKGRIERSAAEWSEG